jgi:hypothetical protein
MRLDDGPSSIVDRPAEADADAAQDLSFELGPRKEFRHGDFDLSPNAVGAVGGKHRAAPESDQRAVARADAELQFRAPDFDAEIHDHPNRRRFLTALES